jgi:hypothetical protein
MSASKSHSGRARRYAIRPAFAEVAVERGLRATCDACAQSQMLAREERQSEAAKLTHSLSSPPCSPPLSGLDVCSR